MSAICLPLGAVLSFGLFGSANLCAEDASVRPGRDLNSYFPFSPVSTAAEWQPRRTEIEQRVRLAAGLWPMPDKTPLNAKVHGRVDRDDYTVDRVIFESLPGHYVTGSLYLPKVRRGKMPAILSPHGHQAKNGRFDDLGIGSPAVATELNTGAETLENAARSIFQARCVQLARMGCAVFLYDILGMSDSVQFPAHRHGEQAEGFVSVQGDLRLQTHFGLQTWNSIRALDFLLSVDGVDPERVACTGESGGGTQTMMLSGLDQRIKAAFPCVMVSTAMQGGCVCENAHYLRINQGNIDIAALVAPRPLGMTVANDWTKELETKGLPELKGLYGLLGVPERVGAHIATQFPHNYNLPSRKAMYAFLNRHFKLGLAEPIEERDFVFLTPEEATVWSGSYPKPSGNQVGLEHEKQVCNWMSLQAKKQVDEVLSSGDADRIQGLLGAAWSMMVGRETPRTNEVKWEPGVKEDKGTVFVIDGVVRQLRFSENVEVRFWYPKNWNGTVDVLLTLDGPGAEAEVQKRIERGVAVAIPKLYLAGAKEQPRFGDNLKAKWDGSDYREYSAYTFGYNPTLLARRVHDVSTVVAMMKGDQTRPVKSIRLAVSPPYTAVGLVAGAVLGKDIGEVEVERDGFRFENLTNHWDPDFVPGAVKYGDVDGLMKLCGKVSFKAK